MTKKLIFSNLRKGFSANLEINESLTLPSSRTGNDEKDCIFDKNKEFLPFLDALTSTKMQAAFVPTNNLHSNIKYLIRVSQVFGMFPLSNLLDEKYSSVTFKWMHPWTFYAIFITIATVIFTVMSFVRMCINDFQLHLLDSFLFCFNALLILLAFFKLAKEWPQLLYTFCRTENWLRNYTYQKNCKITFIALLTITTTAIMLEHSLAVANTYMNINSTLYLELNRTHLEQYFIEEFPFIFDYLPYSLILGLLSFFVNLCNVFSWSFVDSFIMIMSYALSYRFKQIHYNIKNGISKKYESTLFWSKIREDYSRVAILCQKVNKRMANIVLISFGANMYFVVTQLYKGLVTRRTIVDQCYFMYSFGVLLFRTIFVIMYGSMVHTESKKPLSYLICMRNEGFSLEILTVLTYIATVWKTLKL